MRRFRFVFHHGCNCICFDRRCAGDYKINLADFQLITFLLNMHFCFDNPPKTGYTVITGF